MLCFSASGGGQGPPRGTAQSITEAGLGGWYASSTHNTISFMARPRHTLHSFYPCSPSSAFLGVLAPSQVREDGANAKCRIGTVSPWSSQRDLCSQAHLRQLALIFHTHHRLMFCLHSLLGKVWVHSTRAIGVLGSLPGYLSTICFQNPLELRCKWAEGGMGVENGEIMLCFQGET